MSAASRSATVRFLRQGKPATSYWLVPSATSVRYNPDTGVWSPSSVSCARMQQTGSGSPESSTYGALVAQYLDANGSILTQSSISNGQAASFGRYGQHQVPIMAIRFIWQASSQLASVTVQAITDGTEGPQGAIAVNWKWDDIVRNGGLPGGRGFQNGSQGCTYLDSVLVGEAQYRCVTSHAYAVGENPQTDSRWEMYSIQYNSVATDLLMARMASINFLAGNTLSILNANNDVVARLQAGSGIFPVLYIAPVRKPVAVDFYFAVSTSSNPAVPSALSWVEGTVGCTLTKTASQYVHYKYVVRYSDGSCEDLYFKNVFGDSTINFTLRSILFYAAINSAGQGSEMAMKNPDCTTESKPFLLACAQWRDGESNIRYFTHLVGQWSRDNSSYGQNALLKLYSDGSVFFGSEGGSSISINPDSTEISFRSEKGSLIIDSKQHTAISDFLGSLASSTLKSQTWDAGTFQTAKATSLAPARSALIPYGSGTFNTTAPCTAKITIFYRVWLVAGTRGTSGFQPTCAQGSGSITLDGEVIAGPATVIASSGETKHTDTMQVVVTHSLPPGSHKIEAVASLVSGYAGGSVDCDARAMVEISYQQQVCRYFGNGFAIGSTTSNYCMAYNNSSGVMCLDFLNSSGYGLKIDSTGVKAVGPGNTTKNLLT